jgi:hypothetical protein
MKVLEEASDSDALQKAVDSADVRATDELFAVINEGVKLSPILERLVRFESSASYAAEKSDAPADQSPNGNAELRNANAG